MEQLTKNQAVATSQEAVQNQNEPQLRDENAHNDKSVHGVLNPTYQAGLRRDAVQPDIEAERRLLRVSGIVMRLRMFLLLITFLKASHSFRNRLLVICKNAYLFATMIMTSVSSPFSCC